MKMRGSLFLDETSPDKSIQINPLDETLDREVLGWEDYSSSVSRFTTRVLRLPFTSSGSRIGMEPVGV